MFFHPSQKPDDLLIRQMVCEEGTDHKVRPLRREYVSISPVTIEFCSMLDWLQRQWPSRPGSDPARKFYGKVARFGPLLDAPQPVSIAATYVQNAQRGIELRRAAAISLSHQNSGRYANVHRLARAISRRQARRTSRLHGSSINSVS